MKTRILVGLTLAMSVAVGVGYTQRASIAERLMSVALPARMGTDQVATLEDGLHVALCGAGGNRWEGDSRAVAACDCSRGVVDFSACLGLHQRCSHRV